MNWLWRHFYRQYRLLTWLQYTALRRLTPAGWLLLLSFFLVLVMSINRDSMVTSQGFALLLFLIVSATVPCLFFSSQTFPGPPSAPVWHCGPVVHVSGGGPQSHGQNGLGPLFD